MSDGIYDIKERAYEPIGALISGVIEPEGGSLYQFNSGSHTAFKEIYEQLYPSVFYFAKRFVSTEDAADITAEVFGQLWKHDKNFSRIQSIKSFLQVSVRNACLNHLEKTRFRETSRKDIAYLQDEWEEGGLGKNEEQAILLGQIYREIEKLPKESKKIFKLIYFEGLKPKTIAAKFGISEGTVRTQKQRALRALRTALGRTYLLVMSILSIFDVLS
jgi:RNA polymerase sigma-70 factor (family 1)